jgi:hypothetical protein
MRQRPGVWVREMSDSDAYVALQSPDGNLA